MAGPEGGFCIVSNLWIREMRFMKKGDVMEGHKHTFDHATLLASGKFLLEIEGEDSHELSAPCVAFIEKDRIHKITALQDDSLAYCLHGIHDPDNWDHIINPEMMPQFNGRIDVPLAKPSGDFS